MWAPPAAAGGFRRQIVALVASTHGLVRFRQDYWPAVPFQSATLGLPGHLFGGHLGYPNKDEILGLIPGLQNHKLGTRGRHVSMYSRLR